MVMKFHLFQIPDEGMQRKLEMPAASLRRLVEAYGPQQGQVSADLFVRQRGGNVEVTGRLRARLDVPCNRCLDPAVFEIDEAFEVTLAPETRLNEMNEDTSLSSGDLDVSFFDGEQIDLATLVEDELMLCIPESVCEEDEDGRCVQCGRAVDDLFRALEGEDGNHPFAKLKQFIK